jgi:hypothetical protein
MATLGDLEKVLEQQKDQLTPEDSEVLREMVKALAEVDSKLKRRLD